LNLTKSLLEYQGISEEIQYQKCTDVNFTDVNDIVVPISVKKEFRNMILKRKKAFSTTEEALPFNTCVTATIRTVDNEPIYARSYPSLMKSRNY